MRGFDIFDLLVRFTEMKPDASIARLGETSHYLIALPTESLPPTGMLGHRAFPVDVLSQISLFGKLKLRNCARPGKSCRVF
jgi:hypothetical protein